MIQRILCAPRAFRFIPSSSHIYLTVDGQNQRFVYLNTMGSCRMISVRSELRVDTLRIRFHAGKVLSLTLLIPSIRPSSRVDIMIHHSPATSRWKARSTVILPMQSNLRKLIRLNGVFNVTSGRKRANGRAGETLYRAKLRMFECCKRAVPRLGSEGLQP